MEKPVKRPHDDDAANAFVSFLPFLHTLASSDELKDYLKERWRWQYSPKTEGVWCPYHHYHRRWWLLLLLDRLLEEEVADYLWKIFDPLLYHHYYYYFG